MRPPRKACQPCHKAKRRCSHIQLLPRRTCLACKRTKVRCDQASPSCGRCTRLDVPCIEQTRAPGALNPSSEGTVLATRSWGDFTKLWKENAIDVDRTCRLVETWTRMSVDRGHDVTFGLSTRIAKAVRYTPDLLSPREMDKNVVVPVFDGFDSLEEHVSNKPDENEKAPIKPIWRLF